MTSQESRSTDRHLNFIDRLAIAFDREEFAAGVLLSPALIFLGIFLVFPIGAMPRFTWRDRAKQQTDWLLPCSSDDRSIGSR